MSLSNPTLTNPAQHFFQWSGSLGKLQWFDKTKGEKGENVEVRLPFSFIVLDQLATITGYNQNAGSGFWSNEVRNITKDELFVKTKSGPFEAGLYANLPQTFKNGGKYAKSIYIAHKIQDEWVIGNIKASGSALSAWIEFTKAHAVDSGKIVMTRGEELKTPKGDAYYPPKFTWEKWDTVEYEAAVELDRELQNYLAQYLVAPREDEDGLLPSYDEVGKATPAQIADFENRRTSAENKPKKDDVVIEDFGDEPINLDDIPF